MCSKNCSVCYKQFLTKNIKRKTCSDSCKIEQSARTIEKLYGARSALKNKELEAKRRQTNIKKYGFESAMTNKEIQAKQHSTNKKRYDCKVASQRHMTNFSDFNKDYIIEHFTTDGVVTLKDRIEFMRYFNIKNIKSALYRLKKKGIPAQLGHNFSIKEKEILSLLKEKFPEFTFIENDRTTIKRPNSRYFLEIDILIKKDGEIVCGVEYNGDYYHERDVKDSKESLKSKLCEEAGFRLIHIWESAAEDDLLVLLEFLENFKKLSVV